MKKVSILDCTLRDGGYINNWSFGKENIQFIIDKLVNSSVDYIEVGYYSEHEQDDSNRTIFKDLVRLNNIVNLEAKYLVMINYSEVDIKSVPDATEVPNVYGIRVAFHKKDKKEGLDYCQQLKNKGYRVFVQPMVTMSYSNDELTELINQINIIKPYSMYFVDSFGFMMCEDIINKFRFVGNLLDKDIVLGFHSHNNLQLSYANALSLIDLDLEQSIIIDSSVYGMGRGAGNLNTELIIEYINNKYGKRYNIEPIIEIIDRCLSTQKEKSNWGYSLEYFLSANFKCHPNYSKFFMSMENMCLGKLLTLLSLINEDKKVYFDKDYAKILYNKYIEEYNK